MTALSSAPARIAMLMIAIAAFVGTWDHRPVERQSNSVQEIAARRDALIRVQLAESRADDSQEAVAAVPAVLFDEQHDLVVSVVAADSEVIENSINFAKISESDSKESSEEPKLQIKQEVLWHDPRFQLPHVMTPGQYRVVDNLGHIDTLVLTIADLEYQGVRHEGPSEDFYQVVNGGRRWYFIRIDSPEKGEPQASLDSDKIEAELVIY